MSDVFDTSIQFSDLNLSEGVMKGLDAVGFVHPTHIQAQLIGPIIDGIDVIGQARTGSGKTAAFALPILSKADEHEPLQALILAPTRELALQIMNSMKELGQHTGLKITSVVGGESSRKQVNAIKDGAHIIVGTPGRVMDLYQQKQLHFRNIKWAVLDEVDRMFDIGFRDDIRKILGKIKNDHQTIFVSATLNDEIEGLARRNMKDNVQKIITVTQSLTVSQVNQKYVPVDAWDKRRMLIHLIKHEDPELTVVFCKTKATVRKVTDHLRKKNVPAREIHGDLRQSKRNSVMKQLRSGNLEVLVASDLAARGLDVDGITHVINYDLPEDPEVYIHRIGRTARAGRKGIAWSFVTKEEGQRLTEIEKLAGVLIEKLDYPDFDHRDDPKAVRESAEKEERKFVEPEPSEEQIASKFPSGFVPKGPPRRRGGTVRRGRR